MLPSTTHKLCLHIFLFPILSLLTIGCFPKDTSHNNKSNKEVNFKNMIVISWDGLSRPLVQDLLKKNRLPNLQSIIRLGSYSDISEVKNSNNLQQAESKRRPYWLPVLTGYPLAAEQAPHNEPPASIVAGPTIFDHIKKKSNKKIHTIFIHNFEEKDETSTFFADSKKNYINDYQHHIKKPIAVGKKGIRSLQALKNIPFFALFQFNNQPFTKQTNEDYPNEMSSAAVENDALLGKFLEHLSFKGIRSETVIFVISTTNQENRKSGLPKPLGSILVSNIRGLKKTGHLLDVVPTILDLYHLNSEEAQPKLRGASLLTTRSHLSQQPSAALQKETSSYPLLRIGYFHGGRTSALYRAMIYGNYEYENVNVDFITKNLRSMDYYKAPYRLDDIVNIKGFGKATGDELVDLMLQGKVDAATIGEASFIKQIAAGKPIIAIAELGFDLKEMPGHAILMRKGTKIHSPQELAKLHFASRRSSGGDDIFLNEFLLSKGLKLKNLKISRGLDERQLDSQLSSGEIDAAYYHLVAATKMVKKNRAYIYQKLDWLNPELSQSLLVVTKESLLKNRASLIKFIRAYMKRVHYENSLSRPFKEAISTFRPIKRGVDLFINFKGLNIPQYRNIPTVREKLLNRMASLLLKHKTIPKKVILSPLIDNSLVESVAKELYNNTK